MVFRQSTYVMAAQWEKCLGVLFTAMFHHSFVPRQFLTSFLVPIVKDKRGDVSDSNNYRGIALSSVISKVLEHVILQRADRFLGSSIQQFGFKKGHSCNGCSFALRETAQHFLSRGNERVYVCSLDLSKAYDRVSYFQLFRLLLERDFPIAVVKLLADWYSNQEVQVRWQDQLSGSFGVRNGVRQGSVLSPALFNIYVDGLVRRLSRCGYGARMAGDVWYMRMILD
eukprot:m.217288 g.217288  ORF g.217288 m.217288 type:complete len:226 (+) comp39881_c1_seq2:865-1542(+)